MGVMNLCFIISKSLESDLLAIKDDLENIIEKIKEKINDEELFFDIRLILDELISNGVRHGNKKNIDKMINIYVEISERYIKIEVDDEGEGFIYDREDYDPLKLTCGGRGLRIVDGLSDEFNVQKNKAVSIKYI